MASKTVFQMDRAGLYVGMTDADESPLELGVFLMPRGCVDVSPPAEWPADKWPRWLGGAWELIPLPKLSEIEPDPVAKLQAFLAANPDVAAIINAPT